MCRTLPSPFRSALSVALVLVGFSASARSAGQAQDQQQLRRVDLGASLVTAKRRSETQIETPYTSESISSDEIENNGYRTTPQILRDIPGVLVQETSPGQGSPYVRGFTGYRNLFLVDGIRLNNSVFRSGPNQYWSTVDPLSIDRIEVVKGPASVLYGSDALGGTVNAITKTPFGVLRDDALAGEFYYRYASAENSHLGRIDSAAVVGDGTAVMASVGRKDFGEIEGGRDIGTQWNTAYDEWNADLKLESRLDDHTRLVVAYQNVRQFDVPRTHSTIFAVPFEGSSVGSDRRRDLDQTRELAYVQLHGEDVAASIDSYSLSVSWHEQEEVRHRTRGNGAMQTQGFGVDTLGFFANATSTTSIGRVTYGADYYHDDVDSFSSTQPIQGPVADDATYELLGAFLENEFDVDERLTLTIGGRLNYAAVDADSVLDPVSSTQVDLEDDWTSLALSLRFLYRLVDGSVHLFGGVSQGFRAPNLSDLTRFDTARTNEFEIPAPGLDPEKTTNFEFGVKTLAPKTSSQASVFYTDVRDQIALFPTGNTNASGEFEITKDNIGDGYVAGIEVGVAHEVAPEWTVFGNATYLDGKLDTYPTSTPAIEREYRDRLMPLTAMAGARWENPASSQWVEGLAMYADDADRLSTRDEGDTSRIPPGGTPGYVVFHLRSGWRLGEHTTLHAGVDNIADEDYRIHGSGSNMPGRSLVLGLSVRL